MLCIARRGVHCACSRWRRPCTAPSWAGRGIKVLARSVRRARPASRSPTAHRVVHLPGAHRRRPRPSCAGPWPSSCRQPDALLQFRHVRVHGAPYRLAVGGGAYRLRGPMRRRASDGGGAPPAVHRGGVRRDRKAHPEAYQYAAPDHGGGPLTDAKGNKVDFRNTTFILTSNVGSSVITRDASLGFATARPTRPPTSTVT